MSDKAKQVELLIEQNRRLKETADAVAILHLRLVADIQNNEDRLKSLNRNRNRCPSLSNSLGESAMRPRYPWLDIRQRDERSQQDGHAEEVRRIEPKSPGVRVDQGSSHADASYRAHRIEWLIVARFVGGDDRKQPTVSFR
jgi:hypothetical protein